MPINNKYIQDFVEDEFMHIICKSVTGSLLFKNDANRSYFLKKYAEYSFGYLETYCYILLSNHVHFLVKCVNERSLTARLKLLPQEHLKTHQKKYVNKELTFSEALEFQMKDFFISYAMAFNKENKRSGSLFINPFRRIRITDDAHLQQNIIYIHANGIKHGVCKQLTDFKWSSYQPLLSDQATKLKRNEVMEYFGSKNNFIEMHQTQTQYFYQNALESD
ncbi:hypothetical protein DU508_11660 [Pedobacter chinensis]|uniref:Transposase IS200-like domain-containing protein n=1 Tax=Pedobacter chinensis TaxID=2282421 RepID=A0A369Q1P9_9SPHI|nr:hypothetical protein [Pedobacter chinensis]RDC56258.1 hypothetical protein DU508_11660 [Pedobacter chinensis]